MKTTNRMSALRGAFFTATLLGVAALVGACSSGLGTGGNNGSSNDQAAAATGLGIDFGFDLNNDISAVAIAGAVIPGVTEEEDRKIAFLAITTNSPANNADGGGSALVRDAVVPTDSNGGSDVFLIALDEGLVDSGDAGMTPVAFSRGLVNTFRHSRCMNCHSMGSLAEVGEEPAFQNMPHPGGAEPITSDSGCSDCHNAGAVPFLAGIEWRAPLDANGDFDFRGNTLEELAAKAMSEPFDEHLLNDGRVRWAIESGNVPFVDVRPGGNAGTSSLWDGVEVDAGAVPISFAAFQAQLEVWRDNGFQVTAAGSIKDIALVSRANGSNSTGNGVAVNPVLTWVPNPAYDPSNPSAQPAGEVVVAFESDSSNLIPGGNGNTDIYRSRTPMFIDRDPSNGGALIGGIDLDYGAAAIDLVSVRNVGGNSNGNSTDASIDGTGEHVAFTSTATNIVAGFGNQNGGDTDVFYRNMSSGIAQLVSATTAGGTQGGTSASRSAVISPTGLAIAFSTEADNLLPGDTNGVEDIVFTQIIGGTPLDLARADVTSGGDEGVGGGSSDPVIVVQPNGTISVAFTSMKTNLAVTAATQNVFIHESGTTTLLSQTRTGGSSNPGNGDSLNVSLSPVGDCAVFTTLADNLDLENPDDANGVADAILVDLATVRASGNVLTRRLSVDALGQTADAASNAAMITSFRDSIGSFDTTPLATFRTNAESLGATRQNIVASFLSSAGGATRTDFTTDVLVGAAPLSVMFSDASNGAPTSWAWDFGDGGTSTEQNPTHIFTDPGTYAVELTVDRDGMNPVTIVKNGLIRALEPLNLVGFSADNTSGPTTLSTAFSAVLSGSTEGISYLWDFGDGGTSTDPAPAHNYTTVGSFDVTLTVTGVAGMDSLTQANYITTTTPSGASFFFNRLGLRTNFFSGATTGNPTSRTWNFGDGTTLGGNVVNPSHDYSTNGTYVVTLTINGPGGSDMRTQSVTTNARPFSNVYDLLAPNGCTSCHSGGSPSGGLLFNSASQFTVYNELVNDPAEGNACDNMGRIRVIPFNANGSLLLQTLLPGACNSGTNMNIGNWSSAERNILIDWINDGAARLP